MEIGEVIKMLIKNRGLSQATVAEKIGKTPASLSQIVNGVHKPQPETLESLSKVLGVPVRVMYFLTLSEDDIPEANRELYKTVGPMMEDYFHRIFGTNPEDLKKAR